MSRFLLKRGATIVKNKYLSNAEYEAMFGLWLIGALMSLRGITFLFTEEASIQRSDLYSMMDGIMHFNLWGVIFIVAALIIIGSSVSQSIKKYYGLIVGNGLGVLIGFPLSFISFAESHMTITSYTVTLIAFFNFLLVVHSGVVIWKERKRIRSLRG